MTSTAKQTTPEVTLTWTSKSEWGSVGNTHRAKVTLDNGDRWSFVVDQPRKGYWTARGWRADADQTGSGDMVFYREDKTLKGAKAQVQAQANLAATSTCAECRKVAGHKLDCGTGWRDASGNGRVVLRAVDEGAQLLADHIQPVTAGLDAAKGALAKLGTVAQAAASGPVSGLVRALIAAQPCGCKTPVHRMSCGNGATPRVIRTKDFGGVA